MADSKLTEGDVMNVDMINEVIKKVKLIHPKGKCLGYFYNQHGDWVPVFRRKIMESDHQCEWQDVFSDEWQREEIMFCVRSGDIERWKIVADVLLKDEHLKRIGVHDVGHARWIKAEEIAYIVEYSRVYS